MIHLDQIFEFSCGLILLFLSAVALIVSAGTQLRKAFLCFGAFFLTLAVYLVARSQVLMSLHADPDFWVNLRVYALSFAGPAGLWVARELFPVRYAKFLNSLIALSVLVACCAVSAQLALDLAIASVHRHLSISGVVNIAAVLGIASREILGGNRRIRFLGAGILILLATSVSDILIMNGLVKGPLTLQFGSFAFALVVALYMGRKMRIAQVLIANFRVLLPSKIFNEILREPMLLERGPEQHELTVIFVDIVDSTRSISHITPIDSFRRTSEELQHAVRAIHAHDGIVEKTLGDGLLGYFGYPTQQADQSDTGRKHREAAIAAALQIQRETANRIIAQGVHGQAMPVRIGINTGEVIVGNIGGDERFEISAVGIGVVMAQRFEQSADAFMILAGESSVVTDIGAPVVSKNVRIKHNSDLITAYEINPFQGEPETIGKCTQIHRDRLNVKRLEGRTRVAKLHQVTCRASLAVGYVEDISQSGLSLVLNRFYARGVDIEVQITSSNAELNHLLCAGHINEFTVRVQWARESQGMFVHGCRVIGLNRELRARLHETLTQFGVNEISRSA